MFAELVGEYVGLIGVEGGICEEYARVSPFGLVDDKSVSPLLANDVFAGDGLRDHVLNSRHGGSRCAQRVGVHGAVS